MPCRCFYFIKSIYSVSIDRAQNLLFPFFAKIISIRTMPDRWTLDLMPPSKTQQNAIRKLIFSFIFHSFGAGWMACSFLLVALIFSKAFVPLSSHWMDAILGTINHTIWSMILVWILVASQSKHRGKFTIVLSVWVMCMCVCFHLPLGTLTLRQRALLIIIIIHYYYSLLSAISRELRQRSELNCAITSPAKSLFVFELTPTDKQAQANWLFANLCLLFCRK